jgi:hypothetical protein
MNKKVLKILRDEEQNKRVRGAYSGPKEAIFYECE